MPVAGIQCVGDPFPDAGALLILISITQIDGVSGESGLMSGLGSHLYLERRYRFIWGGNLSNLSGMSVIASGGVGKMDDLLALSKLGVSGAIVGKAIYDGRVDLKEALAVFDK